MSTKDNFTSSLLESLNEKLYNFPLKIYGNFTNEIVYLRNSYLGKGVEYFNVEGEVTMPMFTSEIWLMKAEIELING